jgi:hypothetical protein
VQQVGIKYYKLYLLVTLPLMKGFPETVCMLIVCILYLSFNISIIFKVFVICLLHTVISLFWSCILAEVSSGVQHVLHTWFTLNCIYKLHCTSKYSCMNVEFYACKIWSFQGCDYGECCLVGCDIGIYLPIFFEEPAVFIFMVGDVKCKNVRCLVLWWW